MQVIADEVLINFKKYDLLALRCEAGNMYDEHCLKIIGANIKLLRTCRGISPGELARALVISQTHLSNIECCRVAVNFRVLLRAANALECTLDDLLQLEFTELTKTVMEVREYFSAQDGYALNVTGKLVIKEKSPEPEPSSDNYAPSSDSKYTGTLTNIKAEKMQQEEYRNLDKRRRNTIEQASVSVEGDGIKLE